MTSSNAAAVSKLHQNWQPVLVAIIDWMIEAALVQEFMFARTRRSVSCRSNFLCDIQCGQSNSAAGVMKSIPTRRFANLPSLPAERKPSGS